MLEFAPSIKKVTFKFGSNDKELLVYLGNEQGTLKRVADAMSYAREEHVDKVTFLNPVANENATRWCVASIEAVNDESERFVSSTKFRDAAVADKVQELLNS